MAKVYIKHPLVQNMMGNGTMENTMELVHLYGQMEVFTKENGKIAEKMEKESLQV